MKGVCVLLLSLLAIAFAVNLDAPITNKDLINGINSNPSSSWIAGENHRLEGMNVRDFTRLLGVKKSLTTMKPPVKIQPKMDVPTSFDARINWPGCIGPVLDQGHCGSCWAFGAVESLSDRLCIQSKGAVNVSLSEQMVVSCDTSDGGCDGGEPILAWQFLKKQGTVTTDCYPYDMGSCHHPGCSEWTTPSCNSTCQNGASFTKFKHYAKSAYTISSDISDIQTEIITNGPVEVTFAVYEDFATYTSGVYIHTNGSLLGYHAVKNIGWGVDASGVDYWVIQNSWNSDWGMNGFFYIRRGTDECGIESDVVAGLGMI
jgi:cathepsin B